MEYLTFRLAGQTYGVDILQVREIRGFERGTAIANAPKWMLGIMNLRGAIVPLIDLRARLAMHPQFDANTVTIVVSVMDRTMGVVVDAVRDVVNLTEAQIKPAPQMGAVDARYIQGIGTVGEGSTSELITLVDLECAFSEGEFALIGNGANEELAAA